MPFATCLPACSHGACSSSQIFESITLEDVHQGTSKSVSLGSRVLTFDVKPSFTSGSQLVFTDDDSGVGARDLAMCADFLAVWLPSLHRLTSQVSLLFWICRKTQVRYASFWSWRNMQCMTATAVLQTCTIPPKFRFWRVWWVVLWQ